MIKLTLSEQEEQYVEETLEKYRQNKDVGEIRYYWYHIKKDDYSGETVYKTSFSVTEDKRIFQFYFLWGNVNGELVILDKKYYTV